MVMKSIRTVSINKVFQIHDQYGLITLEKQSEHGMNTKQRGSSWLHTSKAFIFSFIAFGNPFFLNTKRGKKHSYALSLG